MNFLTNLHAFRRGRGNVEHKIDRVAIRGLNRLAALSSPSMEEKRASFYHSLKLDFVIQAALSSLARSQANLTINLVAAYYYGRIDRTQQVAELDQTLKFL